MIEPRLLKELSPLPCWPPPSKLERSDWISAVEELDDELRSLISCATADERVELLLEEAPDAPAAVNSSLSPKAATTVWSDPMICC
jgi:hypothetical protein